MRPIRSCALAAALLVATSIPSVAQQSAPASAASTSLTADLLRDIGELERKFVGLARAIPADKYAWRPSAGVRSNGEVVLHVASDNYLIPAILGHKVPAVTGITNDYKTAQAFEKQQIPRDSAIAELERSFVFVKQALSSTPEARLGDKVTMFGQPFTLQQAWILATTHLHEHLGQFIAYARSNSVTPPWSQN